MPRSRSITVKVTPDEYEWLRRKSYWANRSVSAILRTHIHDLVAEEGYLRPRDDEPQDFGYEKEMMQLVLSVQNERAQS